MSKPINKVKDLKDLLVLLTQTEEDREKYLYNKLSVGDIWWIPDEISSFGKNGKHPWVVIRPYRPTRSIILASPRTTRKGTRKTEFFTPAKIIAGLEQDGVILLSVHRNFSINQFIHFDYIGRLPEIWINQLQQAHDSITRGIQ